MTNHNRNHAPGVVTQVLTPELLNQIHDLNKDFLELLICQHAHGARSQSLPSATGAALAQLPAAALQAIALSPLTLYCLNFSDGEFWANNLRRQAAATGAARYDDLMDTATPDSHAVQWQRTLCKAALFLAWHIAAAHPLAARLLYGMPDTVIAQLSAGKLWQLRKIALAHAQLLLPRWPLNPCFWPCLIKYAAPKDAVRLQATKLLGSHLLATDLQAAQGLYPADRRAVNVARMHSFGKR